jgi:hypothetical protein
MFEHSSRKLLARLAQEAPVSLITACLATRTLYLRPYKIRQVQVIEENDCDRRKLFCNRFSRAVPGGVLDPKLTFFTHEAWFYLNGCINVQSSRCWSSIYPRQAFEIPLHGHKIGVRSATTATRTVGPMLFEKIY